MRTRVVVSYFLDVAAFSWTAAGTNLPIEDWLHSSPGRQAAITRETDRPWHHLADGQPAELFAPTTPSCGVCARCQRQSEQNCSLGCRQLRLP